jgi:hypothetical protein
MRRALYIAVCAATVASGCAGPSNDEHAYFTANGPTYRVEMKGRRRALAHDPISAVRGRTYEETLTLELPRIEGVIDGADIPVKPGHLRYSGRIVITQGKMNVDLYYDNRDDPKKVPLLWNGDYRLVRKDPAGSLAYDGQQHDRS